MPEMIKKRPVVIIAERLNGRSSELLTVVPLSSKPPWKPVPYQIEILLQQPLSPNFPLTTVWAKCDMIAVVARQRLDRFRIPGIDGGQHRWVSGHVTRDQVAAIRGGVVHGLGQFIDKSV